MNKKFYVCKLLKIKILKARIYNFIQLKQILCCVCRLFMSIVSTLGIDRSELRLTDGFF